MSDQQFVIVCTVNEPACLVYLAGTGFSNVLSVSHKCIELSMETHVFDLSSTSWYLFYHYRPRDILPVVVLLRQLKIFENLDCWQSVFILKFSRGFAKSPLSLLLPSSATTMQP